LCGSRPDTAATPSGCLRGVRCPVPDSKLNRCACRSVSRWWKRERPARRARAAMHPTGYRQRPPPTHRWARFPEAVSGAPVRETASGARSSNIAKHAVDEFSLVADRKVRIATRHFRALVAKHVRDLDQACAGLREIARATVAQVVKLKVLDAGGFARERP